MAEEPDLDQAIVAAVAAAPDAVLLFDDLGTIVHANPAVADVLGWDPAALLGTNIGRLVHPDDRASALASSRSFQGEGAKARTPSTLRLRGQDGDYMTAETNGNPVQVPDGPKLNLMIARNGEFLRLLSEALDQLSGVPDLDATLRILPDMLRWRVGVKYVTIVRDVDGELRRYGDDIPAELADLSAAGWGDPDLPAGTDVTPFVAAWGGEDQTGDRRDVPASLHPVLDSLGVEVFRLRPVLGLDERARIVITMWSVEVGHNPEGMEPRIRALTNLAQVSLHVAEHHERLVHEARHDALTGLANRRAFHDALGQGRGHDQSVAVLYVDLDRFKPVNDEWGHEAGDRLLAEVAARLVSACRDGDTVARLGGDEFAVFCPSCDRAAAEAIANRFIHTLGEPIDVGRATVTIDASVGIATGAAPDDATDLARLADDALYRAKASGDRITVAASTGTIAPR
jgi:diguanylate cyclase (GGDEF)-like protein/PAS domain S-box-containing protein